MLTAKMMHPDSFAIQFEAYNCEKSEPGREREAARLLADMIRRQAFHYEQNGTLQSIVLPKSEVKSTYPNWGRGIRWWHWLFTTRGLGWSRHIWLKFWSTFHFLFWLFFQAPAPAAKTADSTFFHHQLFLPVSAWSKKNNKHKNSRTAARCAKTRNDHELKIASATIEFLDLDLGK